MTAAGGRALPLRVGIVGSGNIAGPYARDITSKPELELVAATDIDRARADALVAEHGGRAFATLDDLLASDVDIVVNLTVQDQHAPVTRTALEAGKHVHSEKPLALTPEDAWPLVELARERGVRLSASPFTWMSVGQQTAWREVRRGAIGQVRMAAAEVDWGRIETWHPAPIPFYAVGPLVDVGVYPLTLLTTWFGPARRVHAVGRVLAPDRVTRDGTPYRITTPDLQLLVLELATGVIVRLTASFYLGQQSKGHAAVQVHGDEGSLWLDHFFQPDSAVEVAKLGDRESHRTVPHLRQAPEQMDWSTALVDLAEAIRDDRPHRATGDQAAHVVDILAAARASMAADGVGVDVSSSFPQPAPMPWAE